MTTAQGTVEDQQAGGGPQPPPPAEQTSNAARNAAIVAGAAATAATLAPPATADIAYATATKTAAASILAAFERFVVGRRSQIESDLMAELGDHSDLSSDQRAEIVDRELEAEKAFQAKMRQRLGTRLSTALAIQDPYERDAAVGRILDYEKRILGLREAAITGRASGAAEAASLKRRSPRGAGWTLDESVEQHTADCILMAGRIWPWSVLDDHHPPLHLECPCGLIHADEAERRGMTHADADQVVYARSVVETPAIDELELHVAAHELAIAEALYEERWAGGTEFGGRFRPRVGGDPGALIGLRRHRQRMPGARVEAAHEGHGHLGAEHQRAIDNAATHARSVGASRYVVQTRFGPRISNVAPQAGAEYHEARPDGTIVHVVPGQPPAAPPSHTPAAVGGRPTRQDVETVVRASKPTQERWPLAPQVEYDASLRRSEARGETLALPPGFFRLTQAKREAVVNRHFGRRLAESMSAEEKAKLSSSSPTRIAEAYHAINTDGRGEFVAAHPDDARLIATAAHARGFALHPEATRLVGAPHSSDHSQETHPAQALAERLKGMTRVEAHDLANEAGYYHAGQHELANGEIETIHRNFNQGADIRLVRPPEGRTRTVRVELLPRADNADHYRGRLFGSDVKAELEGQGFGPWTPHGGDWVYLAHGDGRGLGLRLDDRGGVTDARTYRPSEQERKTAEVVAARRDPTQGIKPGMSNHDVARILESPGGGWRIGEVHNRSESDFQTQWPNVHSSADYQHRTTGEHLRVIYEKHGDGVRVVNVGRPDATNPAQLVDQATYEHQQSEAQQAEQARLRERRQALADKEAKTWDPALKALEQNKTPTTLVGAETNDAVRKLRDEHGWDVVDRRSSTRKGDRVITYTLRKNGATLKITGGRFFRDQGVRDVKFEPPPPQASRTRIVGRAPKDASELYSDALGRADELAQRFGVKANVTSVHETGVARGAAAHHEFNGAIVMRGKIEGRTIREYLAKHNAGEPISDREHLDYYRALEILQHEVNHGVMPAGDREGGMAFGARDYSGHGKSLEEALTEEAAHHGAVEWLRSHGMTDTLAALKRNPDNYARRGTYEQYRTQLRHVFDQGHVPEGERTALVHRMKFQMGPEERAAHVEQITGKSLHAAMFDDPKGRAEMQRNFQPVTRPDLSDVKAYEAKGVDEAKVGDTARFDLGNGMHGEGEVRDASEPNFLRVRMPGAFGQPPTEHDIGRSRITGVEPGSPTSAPTPEGRTLTRGDQVRMDKLGDNLKPVQVPGEVRAVDGRMVKVDAGGMELWQDLNSGRVH